MILLDTHVILWWQAGGERLSKRAAREIARADSVLVSPISCWEIATLLVKGRISLDRDLHQWVEDLISDEQVNLAPLSSSAAVAAGLLTREGFTGDPADRLLYATAMESLVPLVTKDKSIRSHAIRAKDVRVIW